MNRVFFAPEDPRFTERVRLWGVGHAEKMPHGRVERARGLSSFLLVAFHDPVEIELHGRRGKLPAETLVFWDRRRPHYFGNTVLPWSHSWVVFDGTEWRNALPRLRPYFEKPLSLAGREHVHTYFANLLREVEAPGGPDADILVGNIELILREFPRGESHSRWQETRGDAVRMACDLVRRQLAEPLSVGRIAKAAGLSTSRLQQLFRRHLGCSIQEYVERERLQEARYWLMHSGLRISEIAHRVGYRDPYYFSRRFRTALGQSPAQHRADHYTSPRPRLPRKN